VSVASINHRTIKPGDSCPPLPRVEFIQKVSTIPLYGERLTLSLWGNKKKEEAERTKVVAFVSRTFTSLFTVFSGLRPTQ